MIEFNFKRQIIGVLSVVISAMLSLFLSIDRYLIIFLPGLFFGIALTLPMTYSKSKDNFSQILKALFYPIIWFAVILLYVFFQFIIKYSSDKIGYVVIGLISGIAVSGIYEWQFGFRNNRIAYISITILSIISILLWDYFFPNPSDKESNIGEQIAVWQIIVGIGILLNQKKKYIQSTTN